jgi:hypothetical protein
MKKQTMMAIAVALALAIGGAAPAFAADPHSGGATGQPNQNCQAVFPSGTLTPQGFNTPGFANADVHYAGTQSQNSTNPNSVAQYDVACFQNGSR